MATEQQIESDSPLSWMAEDRVNLLLKQHVSFLGSYPSLVNCGRGSNQVRGFELATFGSEFQHNPSTKVQNLSVSMNTEF